MFFIRGGVALALVAALLGGPQIDPVPFGLLSPNDVSWEFGVSFAPDGRTAYFTKSEPGQTGSTIFSSRNTNGHWSTPEVAPFSGQYADADPAVLPDGSAVIFSSQRPPLGAIGVPALYEAFLRGPHAGAVVPLPNNANTQGGESSPSVARDGTIYFILDDQGTRRVYRVRAASEQSSPAYAIGLPGDEPGVTERDIAIDPGQRFLIFSSNRAGGLGVFDLYVSFRHDFRFCAPQHLPAPVNTAWTEVSPEIGRDGHTLFFSSSRSDFAQPAADPLDAGAFAAQLAHYQNGNLRLYRTNIGPWLDREEGNARC